MNAERKAGCVHEKTEEADFECSLYDKGMGRRICFACGEKSGKTVTCYVTP